MKFEASGMEIEWAISKWIKVWVISHPRRTAKMSSRREAAIAEINAPSADDPDLTKDLLKKIFSRPEYNFESFTNSLSYVWLNPSLFNFIFANPL